MHETLHDLKYNYDTLRNVGFSPSSVIRIRLWVYYDKIPICPIFYLLKGEYRSRGSCPSIACRAGP